LTALIAKAAELGLARLTVDGETMALLATPTVNLSGATVKLPPGAFLQASRTTSRASSPWISPHIEVVALLER
jgi:hypothetical protein